MINRKLTISFHIFSLAIILMTYISCEQRTPKDLSKENLIPKPLVITATGSSFLLTDQTSIFVAAGSDELIQIAQQLADKVNPSTGFHIAVTPSAEAVTSGIYFRISEEDTELGAEGYELNISEDLLEVVAHQPAGLFRAIQTIRQLLPASIESSDPQEGPWEIATGSIRDYPNLAYRGVMLDVARHFFEVETVKRYIDLIAAFKMNSLHLHLSDDQGWRIEIKSWPKLATYGGSTEVGGGEGGYYTQEQYAEIVKYAQDRYITIIPEIDMPGHTNAALASYPELNCDGKAPDLYTGTEVGFSTLCTDKEITYQFVEDVIRELAALTPGPYIHIGGDESHVTPLADYIPFINRVQALVHKYGKQVMGWDEIAHASLKPNTIAQYWDVAENAKAAVAQGAKVLFSPAHKIYLDMQYDSTTAYGLHWAAYIEVDSAYIWDPENMVAGLTKEDIIGIEAPLWSETITDIDEIEYMAFPRLPGYAEIGWTPAASRSWEEYKVRLGKQKARFEAMEINYYPSKLVPWVD